MNVVIAIPFNSFKFRNPKHGEIYKIPINIDCKDEIPGRFLISGAELLIEPLCRVKLSTFP